MVIHRTSNGQQLPVPYSAKKGLSWKIAGKLIGRVLLALLLILLLLAVFGTAAHAAFIKNQQRIVAVTQFTQTL